MIEEVYCPDGGQCVDIDIWGWHDVISGVHRWRWDCGAGASGPVCSSLSEAIASCAQAHDGISLEDMYE